MAIDVGALISAAAERAEAMAEEAERVIDRAMTVSQGYTIPTSYAPPHLDDIKLIGPPVAPTLLAAPDFGVIDIPNDAPEPTDLNPDWPNAPTWTAPTQPDSFTAVYLGNAPEFGTAPTPQYGSMPTGEVTVAIPQTPDFGAAPSFNARPAPVFAPGTSMPGFPAMPAEPTNSATLPNVVEPTRPTGVGQFTKQAPTLGSLPELPAVPAPITITPPTLSDIVLPARPTRTTPVFGAVAPGGAPDAPALDGALEAKYAGASSMMVSAINGQLDAWMARNDPSYHARLSSLQAKLDTYMQGGTALNPAVENAIYERSRAKVDAEAKRMQGDAFLSAARRGFTLPDGALMSAVQQARQVGADNNAKAAVEIAVMQAEMEQKNLQFAVTTIASLHKVAVDASLAYHQNLISINGQAVQFSVEIVNAIIKAYEAEVRAFTTRLELYKAEAGVFETLVRASLTEIEIYKAEIEGAKAAVQVDESRVRVYQAQIQAHQSAVETYATNVRAIVELANLEKIKIDAFQAEVQAYTAKTQANVAEWQAYSAAWNGEENKVRIYQAQNQAYATAVQAYSALIDGNARMHSAGVQAYLAEVQSFESEVKAYTAEVQGETAETQAYAAQVDAKARAHEAGMKAYLGAVQAKQAEIQAFTAKVGAYEGEVRAFGAQVTAGTTAYEGKVRGAAATAQAYSAEVGAFESLVRAKTAEFDVYRARVSAEATKLQATAAVDEAELRAFEARVRAAGAKAQANASAIASVVSVNQQALSAYQIASQAAIAQSSAAAEKYKAEGAIKSESARTAAQQSMEFAKLMNNRVMAEAQIGMAAGEVYSKMASAALGGVNALAVGEQA